jgi:hypothetical protein
MCGINGCTKAYGSASSLCAHKRAHHPGWRTGVYDPPPKAAGEAAVEGGRAAPHTIKPPPPSASMPGALAMGAGARGGPAGVWLSVLAADATGRLGALRRSRVRAQRACRDGQQSCANAAAEGAHAVGSAVTACVSVAAHAASAKLCRAMDEAIDAEINRLEDWVMQLDVIAAECLHLTSARFFALMAATPAVRSSGGSLTAIGAAAGAAASIAAAAASASTPSLSGTAQDGGAGPDDPGDTRFKASTLVAPGPARRSARSTPPVGVTPAAGAGVGGSSGEHEQGWESPDSMTLEASPESLQGGSPASGQEDSNGAAPTHPTGLLPLNADEAEPLWQRDLVEELTKAKAVGDVLALGHDAEVLAVVWPHNGPTQ